MYIVCNGCGVYVTVLEKGTDIFGNAYEIAVSKKGSFFLHYVDPFFGGDPVWDYFSSVEKLINWKNKYL